MIKLAVIVVVSVRREPLTAMLLDPEYGQRECEREGFPEMEPAAFVDFFCQSHHKCTPETIVTRVEFGYVEP